MNDSSAQSNLFLRAMFVNLCLLNILQSKKINMGGTYYCGNFMEQSFMEQFLTESNITIFCSF